MSVIQPPPQPRTPPDNLVLRAVRSAGKIALFATFSVFVFCIALSRLPLGAGSASRTFSREFFSLALGLMGLLGIMCAVWSVFTIIYRKRRREQQKESAQNVEHRKPTSRRPAPPAYFAALAITSLALAVLGILAMFATLPPIWLILAAGLLIALAAAAGALWELRQQTTLYRTKATR